MKCDGGTDLAGDECEKDTKGVITSFDLHK